MIANKKKDGTDTYICTDNHWAFGYLVCCFSRRIFCCTAVRAHADHITRQLQPSLLWLRTNWLEAPEPADGSMADTWWALVIDVLMTNSQLTTGSNTVGRTAGPAPVISNGRDDRPGPLAGSTGWTTRDAGDHDWHLFRSTPFLNVTSRESLSYHSH